MKNKASNLIVFFLFFTLIIKSQITFAQKYHYSNVGFFYSKFNGNGWIGKTSFYNLHLSTEHNLNLSKNLTYGIGYNVIKNAMGSNDHTGNVFINGILPIDNMALFVGTGLSYGKKMGVNAESPTKQGYQYLVQGGLRFKIFRRLNGQLDIGNYSYGTRMIPSIGLGFR